MLLCGAIQILELILVLHLIAHKNACLYITCLIYSNGISVAGPV